MTSDTHRSKWLWVLQALLAIVFGLAGAMKLMVSSSELAADPTWLSEVPVSLIRFIGAAELLGALGLIVPGITRIKPGLTVMAAIGLSLVMALAAAFHFARQEFTAIPLPVVLGSLAGWVAWGRSRG